MKVYGELPADAAGVEAPVVDPGTLPPRGLLRRWGWLPVLVVAAAAIAYDRYAGGPEVLGAAGFSTLALASVGMLVRYTDDQHTARVRADRAALTNDADAMVGTASTRVQRPGSESSPSVGVWFGPHGDQFARWIMPPNIEAHRSLPREGDPVAVWAARDRDAVLVRYERAWADAVLDALPDAPAPE